MGFGASAKEEAKEIQDKGDVDAAELDAGQADTYDGCNGCFNPSN